MDTFDSLVGSHFVPARSAAVRYTSGLHASRDARGARAHSQAARLEDRRHPANSGLAYPSSKVLPNLVFMAAELPRIKARRAVCSPAPTCHRSLPGVRTPLMAASVGPRNFATRALILSATQLPLCGTAPGAASSLATRAEALTPAFSRSPMRLLYALMPHVTQPHESCRSCKSVLRARWDGLRKLTA